MKRSPLRLVVNNKHLNGESVAVGAQAVAIDFARLRERGRYWLAMAQMILLLPFQCVAAAWRFCWRTGMGIVAFLFQLVLGIVGLTVIAVLAFGLIRTIFYPLFH